MQSQASDRWNSGYQVERRGIFNITRGTIFTPPSVVTSIPLPELGLEARNINVGTALRVSVSRVSVRATVITPLF